MYKDIYEQEVLESFGIYKKEIENIEEKDKRIDIREIADRCNIQIKENNLIEFKVNKDSKIIYVSDLLDEVDKRFLIAMGIGKILITKTYTIDDLMFQQVIENMQKVAVFEFAKELLMPKNLIIEVLDEALVRLNFYRNQILEEKDKNLIYKYMTKKIKVPEGIGIEQLKGMEIFED